ncbi:uncharacterized protein LOC118394381 isoform X1 [Oncorhynchus keta]|uniref:uncharacterized protein LOC118394381 isoform X1 n=1 Tax=Oncorhynchus keta TaxID=8018 RepID=UPI0015F95F3C|nr:uncharacterized protein LOC118394381 isoform X1 [Oncorhynchus keta]
MEMSGLLSVLLVTSAALLFIANGQTNYDMLREVDKKHVDLAIRYANKNSAFMKYNQKEHLNFLQVIGQSEIKAREFKINLLLKATDCPKASSDSEHKHHPECSFKSRRPYINCVVCSKDFHDSTDPYIDCVLQKDVKKITSDMTSVHLFNVESVQLYPYVPKKKTFRLDALAVSDH